MSRAERDRYIALRHDGVEEYEAFRQVNAYRAVGNWLSQGTRNNWERWFRAGQGLPSRERDPRMHPR